MRFRSRTDGHITGGFYSFRQVGAVQPQHTCAFFHSELQRSEDNLRKSCIVNCSYGHVAISGTAAFTVLAGGSDGSLTKAQYFTCEALTCFIGDLLPKGSLSRPDCASWTTGESCAVTCAEGYRAANESSGTLKCAYDKVARDAVLKGAVPECLSVGCSRDDPLAGVRHEFRDLSYPGSCVVTCKEGYEAGGNILTTILLCLSSGEFVSEAPTVDLSCSQMLCSDTPVQSGVGVNSSCEVIFIGDTCMMFCAEGYQVVSNEASVSMRACNCWNNSLASPLVPERTSES